MPAELLVRAINLGRRANNNKRTVCWLSLITLFAVNGGRPISSNINAASQQSRDKKLPAVRSLARGQARRSWPASYTHSRAIVKSLLFEFELELEFALNCARV